MQILRVVTYLGNNNGNDKKIVDGASKDNVIKVPRKGIGTQNKFDVLNHTLEEENSEMMKDATTENNKDADVDVAVAKDITDSNKVIVEVDGDVAKDIDTDVVKDTSEPNMMIVEVPSEEKNGNTEDKEEQKDTGVEYGDKEDKEEHNNKVIDVEQSNEEPYIMEPQVMKDTRATPILRSGLKELLYQQEGVGYYPPSIEEVIDVADNSIDGNKELHVIDKSVVHVNSEKQTITQRKQIPLQEMHDMVSHNIDFDANGDTRTKDNSRNKKFKKTAEEENLDQVLHQVAREVGPIAAKVWRYFNTDVDMKMEEHCFAWREDVF
ncbi:hypothetical protein RND71_038336 [Anisodus tanguticus]|uniref:Uncharacterized protein n=1 Tax=Anisodus tanguticus TaxID=243964 RepID=A0AAE1UZD7_9SOLA|nr:hypothetical protein RND71_038336 [Anisodus tanguticus]